MIASSVLYQENSHKQKKEKTTCIADRMMVQMNEETKPTSGHYAWSFLID